MNKVSWVRTQKEISSTREELKPSNGLCPILKSKPSRWCLDHNHETFLVRGAISQQANTFEGYINKYFKKYCKKYTNLTISDVLRNIADYYEVYDNKKRDYYKLHYSEILRIGRKLKRMTKNDILSLFPEQVRSEYTSLHKKDLISNYISFITKIKEDFYKNI